MSNRSEEIQKEIEELDIPIQFRTGYNSFSEQSIRLIELEAELKGIQETKKEIGRQKEMKGEKCSEITCRNKAGLCFECVAREVSEGEKYGLEGEIKFLGEIVRNHPVINDCKYCNKILRERIRKLEALKKDISNHSQLSRCTKEKKEDGQGEPITSSADTHNKKEVGK